MKLTLDIGGSKTRAFLYAEDTIEKFEICGGFGKAEDSDSIETELFGALKEKLGNACGQITAVAVNLGGKNKRQIVYTVSALFPNTRVFAHRESEGVLARRIMQTHNANVLIMAGTGCIVFAQTEHGSRVLGGWGKDYGDDGSGYSVGIKAVRYGLKDLDSGKRETSLLTKTLFGVDVPFHFHNISDYAAARDAARDKIPKTREGIAALTKTVVACAKQGCPLAQQVLNEMGEDLADLLLRAVSASEIHAPSVVINGGVTNFYPLWQDAFDATLKTSGKTARVICINDGIDKALQEIVKEL